MNIVLVVFDSLRRDCVGVYENPATMRCWLAGQPDLRKRDQALLIRQI